MFRRGLVTLNFLDRIPQSELKDMPLRKQASMVRNIITNAYSELEHQRENALYFRPLVKYKYAWRGWKIVDRYKKEDKKLDEFINIIEENLPSAYEPYPEINVRILGSGIGVLPLYYALVNKRANVYAYEEDINLHNIAASTPGLPTNLHFIHAVFPEDYYTTGNPDIPTQTYDLRK